MRAGRGYRTIRGRRGPTLPHEVHAAVFDWVLAPIAEAGLIKGERIGVDASTMESNAALRNIVRRATDGCAGGEGDRAARRAVTNNRVRLKSGVAREAFELRGRENLHKRTLLHVAGHNLSLLMRKLIGAGAPREAVAAGDSGIFWLMTPIGAALFVVIAQKADQTRCVAIIILEGADR